MPDRYSTREDWKQAIWQSPKAIVKTNWRDNMTINYVQSLSHW